MLLISACGQNLQNPFRPVQKKNQFLG